MAKLMCFTSGFLCAFMTTPITRMMWDDCPALLRTAIGLFTLLLLITVVSKSTTELEECEETKKSKKQTVVTVKHD